MRLAFYSFFTHQEKSRMCRINDIFPPAAYETGFNKQMMFFDSVSGSGSR